MHHKDHNHDNNPPDGSNWELLCLYCHDNEHSRQLELASQGNASTGRDSRPAATHQPLAELLERKSWFAHRGAFHHCLLLRAELDSRFDEQLFHQHGLEINRKFKCDTKSLVEVVPTIKERREPPVSPGESMGLNKERP